jgi:hypothetical protein
MTFEENRNMVRVDPKEICKLYDKGTFPSQVAITLGVSLSEVLDSLAKRRHEAGPDHMSKMFK